MRHSAQKWTSLPLSHIAKIERTAVFPENIRTGTTYVGLENMTSSGTFVGVGEVATGELASSKFAFTDKHILYGKLRPYLAKIACPPFPGVCSTDILPILPGPDVDRRFLLHFLRQPQMVDYASSKTTGANLPRLSPAALGEFEIPLPPLSEQKRIADILDKADTIRRKRQDVLKVIANSYKSLFLSMFGDPVENHRRLPVSTIANLATRISKGESPKWQGFEYQDHGVQFITSENVRWGHVDTTTPKFIPHAFHAKLERSQLAKDDLLINLVGASVGRTALVPETALPANVNQAVAVVTLDRKQMLPSFLLHQLLNDRVQRVLLGNVVDSARANISLTNIRETTVLVPDMKEQLAWDEVIRGAANLTHSSKRACQECNDLFNSLVQHAFKGEL